MILIIVSAIIVAGIVAFLIRSKKSNNPVTGEQIVKKEEVPGDFEEKKYAFIVKQKDGYLKKRMVHKKVYDSYSEGDFLGS